MVGCILRTKRISAVARSHFVLEEALMRLHGYPDLEQHIAEHRAFSARLAQLEEQAIRQDVSLHIIEFIKQWLMNHIGGSDQSYVPCLRTMPIV
ncbi:MAG: hemerythrin domain-containing protein [Dechloromonas sp.]|uniref:Hemerythrin domain-containing protein n=1 Tax=Candidatus Dechloromonas phosphorivorans TaxID=2899244 RepID=A0A935K098_9RHOO|nr:hemerythrin domain-containing protein [Candidatus Dechloromonas phosphorivorans]